MKFYQNPMLKVYLLCLLVLTLLCSLGCNAQKVRQDANGNYIAIKVTKDSSVNKPTGKTYTDSKGVSYPVYVSNTGKLYVLKTSKNTGNQYKQYLKLD